MSAFIAKERSLNHHSLSSKHNSAEAKTAFGTGRAICVCCGHTVCSNIHSLASSHNTLSLKPAWLFVRFLFPGWERKALWKMLFPAPVHQSAIQQGSTLSLPGLKKRRPRGPLERFPPSSPVCEMQAVSLGFVAYEWEVVSDSGWGMCLGGLAADSWSLCSSFPARWMWWWWWWCIGYQETLVQAKLGREQPIISRMSQSFSDSRSCVVIIKGADMWKWLSI